MLAVYSVRSQFLGLQARECQGWVTGRPAERQGALTAFVAALGALAVVQLIDRLWARPRPFVAHPDTVHLLVAHAADASFPSDHVVAACAIAVVLVSFHRRLGAIALLLAAVLAYDRVYIGVHYPGDVLGGMFLGTLVALLLVMQLAPPMDRCVCQAKSRPCDRRKLDHALIVAGAYLPP